MNRKYDGPLSGFAFNCNLHHYKKDTEIIKKWNVQYLMFQKNKRHGRAVRFDPGLTLD